MATILDKKERSPSPENVLEMSTQILLEGTFPSILLASDDSPTIYVIKRHFNDGALDILGSTYKVPNLDFGTRPDILGPQTGNLTMSGIFAENMSIKEALKNILPDEVLIRFLPSGQLCFQSYTNSEGVRFRAYDPHGGWVEHIEGLHAFYQGIKNGTGLG